MNSLTTNIPLTSPHPLCPTDDDAWDTERIATNSCLCALEEACFSRTEKSLDEYNLPKPSQEHEKFYQDIISGKAEQRRMQEIGRDY